MRRPPAGQSSHGRAAGGAGGWCLLERGCVGGGCGWVGGGVLWQAEEQPGGSNAKPVSQRVEGSFALHPRSVHAAPAVLQAQLQSLWASGAGAGGVATGAAEVEKLKKGLMQVGGWAFHFQVFASSLSWLPCIDRSRAAQGTVHCGCSPHFLASRPGLAPSLALLPHIRALPRPQCDRSTTPNPQHP